MLVSSVLSFFARAMDLTFSEELILKVKHIVADLENVVCLIESSNIDHKESLHGVLAFKEKLEKQHMQYINQFLDYGISQFRVFMENSKFFEKKPSCVCMKCETIGYPSLPNCIHDITLAVGDLLIELQSVRQKVLESVRYVQHFEGHYIDNDLCHHGYKHFGGCHQDRIYISRFILFTNFFLSEFVNCTSDESIFAPYPCENKCCT